jgi:choline dehydrogenase-like flavoprotein
VSAWRDLAADDGPAGTLEADVCLVGAGAAGLFLAVRLAERGLRTVVLEAGPPRSVDARTAGFEVAFDRRPYDGATAGRFFGVGGSTARWGGALVPHTHHDVRTGEPQEAVWRHVVETVEAHGPAVLRQLGHPRPGAFDTLAAGALGPAAAALDRCGFSLQASLYLPFRRKNLATLLGHARHLPVPPLVVCHATATAWQLAPGAAERARVVGVEAQAPGGRRLEVRAPRFILAAGALESARLLLELDEAGGQVLPADAQPGVGLADHLSVTIAEVEPADRQLAAALFAPRFRAGWLRAVRLLEQQPPQGSPRAFAHVLFDNRSLGFEVAREWLGALQSRRLPPITPGRWARGVGELAQLAHARIWRQQLHLPPGTPAHLQLDMEQPAHPTHRVHLGTERDALGRRLVHIAWEIPDADLGHLQQAAARVLGRWGGRAHGLPALTPTPVGPTGQKPHDAYHPVGTCRMGVGAGAVVDLDLSVRGVENLSVVSTGVLPSAGTANPTFTMLCLASDLADRLAPPASGGSPR